MESVKTKSWTDGWWWHALVWIGFLTFGFLLWIPLVVGIIRGAQGRGHALWVHSLVVLVLYVVLKLTILR